MSEAVSDCEYCDRVCPRCRYPVPGGFRHVFQPQPEGSNVVVCNLQRVVGPLGEVLAAFVEHKRHGVGRTSSGDVKRMSEPLDDAAHMVAAQIADLMTGLSGDGLARMLADLHDMTADFSPSTRALLATAFKAVDDE